MAGTGFGQWWKGLQARGDAWAEKRLTPEEYGDAVALDRHIKDHFWRWVGYFLLGAGAGSAIAVALWPELSWTQAFFYAALVILYAGAAVASAWYGYSRWTDRPIWTVFAIFIGLMMGGLLVGVYITNFRTGKPLGEVSWQNLTKGAAIALLMGMTLAALLVSIAHARKREAVLRAARAQAEAERERLARQSVQAELKLLQAQVEPHFLFNTLANLRHLVQTRSPDAVVMLDHLIHYLRTALPEIRSAGSTLGREAELARAYLEILRIRMGGALDFSIEVPAELAREPFPPLMLLSLVENAVKHGVTPVGRGRIEVRAACEAGRLRVTVDDDGRGLVAPIGQGVGLANVRERLRALFGDAARLELSAREGPGTRAAIELPA